ncbi:MAG: SpoIIE family protein phosphatase [Sporichthyaceae bacterium]
MTLAPSPEGFLVEAALIGGEVGADLGHVDWASTALGPATTWPQSLQIALRTVLTSRFPMWLGWGRDLTFFCNDAYRRDTLGRKYPWALGRPAREVWAEVWADVAPRIDSVLATGRATWDEALPLILERNGYPEETYHTFSYSPLHDDAGQTAGLLCVVSEDTERVLAQRRMELVVDLVGPRDTVGTERDLLEHVAERLERDRRSLPFTMVYLLERQSAAGTRARLAACSGIVAGHPAAPEVLPLDDPLWPLRSALEAGPTTVDLRSWTLPLPTGAWSVPPTEAVLVPLPAGPGEDPYGVFVAALNPYRPDDPDVPALIDLIAHQISGGLASLRAYQWQRHRAEDLAALDAAKTAFFTNVSHEFRTPLTLLLGPANDALTDQRDPLTEGQRERVTLVQRNGHRLLRLVNNLLDFSRLEASRMTASYEPVDLAALTGELVSMFRSAFDRAGLTLHLEAEPIGEPVYVDREMWTKVVCNLLSNSLKFTFLGGVTVALRPVDGMATLTVADTGVGIAHEEQPLVFERFQRARATRARTYEGTGIGLALVADLAALHGGEASLSSRLGEGTVVTVRVATGTAHLPPEAVREGVADAVPGVDAAAGFLAETDRWFDPAEVAAGSVADLPDGPRREVLVVDDNADMREYIAGLLRSQFDVRTAPDGRVALASALANVPDLGLTDVRRPGLDGFGLLTALRADRRTALVPVVMLSARAGEEAAIAGMAAGADDYLAKPFSASELFARVHANLELARLRSQDASWRRVLMDTIQDALAVADSDGMLLEVNDAFRELVGYPIDDLPALRPHPWWPDLRTEPEAYAQLAAASAQIADQESGRVTIPFRHASGRRLWIEVMYGSLHDPQSGQRLVVGSFRDVTARTEAVEQQRSVALTLQRSLLGPSRMPAGFAARYSPGERPLEVGGDWYDVIDLGEGQVGLVVGDCIGKGLDAATVMGQLRSACRALLLQLKAPADVLSALDEFAAATPHAEYTSVFCAVIDRHSGNVRYSTAGHPPAVLAHPDGRLELLDSARSVPLAGSTRPLRTQAEASLEPGSLLALYTDGLAERRGEHPDVGIARLADAVRDARALRLEDDVAAAVLEAALPEEGQADDVALLLYRHRAPADFRTTLRPDPAALAPARAALRGWLTANSVPRMELEAILLAAGEACANALEHGHRLAGEALVDLVGTIDEGRLELVVRDRGAWKPPSDRGHRGRGLELMELLMDSTAVDSGPQGTTVRLSKELGRAD